MKAIEQLLRRRIGLNPESIGAPIIARAVRARMKALGLRTLPDYHSLLTASEPEWDELTEAVVVTETWFFRDTVPFQALAESVMDQWLPAHREAGTLRILSLPCSSGEEPCSIVMALLDAGFPPDRLHVEGIDLSRRALFRANRGVYGRNSFRGEDLGFRARHFHRVRDGHAINLTVKSCVHYEQGNLLEPDALKAREPYDIVFFRNLLIYFDADVQASVLGRIHRLVKPGGLLFVGSAEVALVARGEFAVANLPGAFACKRVIPGPKARPAHAARPVPVTAAPPARPPLSRPAAPPKKSGMDPKAGAMMLDLAQRLADQGRLVEAAHLCEKFIALSPDSARAYYLLGLVRDAAGDPAAVECYRRALYLDPHHYDALLQMALLAERSGDHAKARVLKRRAERALAVA